MRAYPMKRYTRRALGGLAGASWVSAMHAQPGPAALRGTRPRVIVIGGGAGGATAAKYLATAEGPIDVTLIEPQRHYTTCFSSNLYLAGLRPIERLAHGYETLASRYGIRVIHQSATGIDPAARLVTLGSGVSLAYDRLVVAPGIAFRDGAIAGYDDAAAEAMPHAWTAGAQAVVLRRQLEEMPDGGVFIITAPPDPSRCPPGPYERASLVAAYFTQHKPRSKILILDAKNVFSGQDLFEDAWQRHYGDMIEWLPQEFVGAVQSVDAAQRSITTSDQTFKADVANVIPAQQAGLLARGAGLADQSGWCPVDPVTFESSIHPDIHLIGDAINAGRMPKSAYAANSQAKACALAIASGLTGKRPAPSNLGSTCYTFLGPKDAVSNAISFKVADGAIATSGIRISKLNENAVRRAQTAVEADAWYDAFTQDIFG